MRDDLRDLPEILIPDNNSLRMLASCYLVCKSHFREVFNAIGPNAASNARYVDCRRKFSGILDEHRDAQAPLLQTDTIEVLKRELSAGSRPDALARCAALLHALSLYIATQQKTSQLPGQITTRASTALGSTEILISTKPESAIARACKRLPRRESEISDMLDKYHPELHLIPVNVGDWRIVSCKLPPATDRLLTARAKRRHVKIAVSPLTLDARLRGRSLAGFPKNQPARFLLDSVGDETSQIVFLNELLERCYDEGISILVLPELRVPPRLLQVIKAFLRNQVRNDLRAGKGLLLVVAGSWHYPDSQEGMGWVNRSVVLDCRGSMVWEHDKLAEYRITRANVVSRPGLKTQLGINNYGGIEAIRRGETLHFCDCALGRLSVAICSGFFHEPIAAALKASGATIFLVPAMTPDIRRIERRASDLVESQHAATFAANCGTIAFDPGTGKISEKAACFYLLPEAGAEPQRLSGSTAADSCLHVYTLQ